MLTIKNYGFYCFKIDKIEKSTEEKNTFVLWYGKNKHFNIKIEYTYKLLKRIFEERELKKLGMECLDDFIDLVNNEGFYKFANRVFKFKNIVVVSKIKNIKIYEQKNPKGIIGITGITKEGKLIAKDNEDLFNDFVPDQNSYENTI